jgi:hypothetical protein
VLARVFGALESLGALVVAAASLLSPMLLDLVRIRWALVVVGALGPFYAVVAWSRLERIDSAVTRRDLDIGLLDELPMFRPLAMPAIEQLADRLERRTFAPGDHVVTQGDEGDRFFVIERGTARVVRNGAVRRELGDGDGFGEIALLRNVPRTASVIATTPLHVRTLARIDFLTAIAGPAAGRAAGEQVVIERLDADALADAAEVPTSGHSVAGHTEHLHRDD